MEPTQHIASTESMPAEAGAQIQEPEDTVRFNYRLLLKERLVEKFKKNPHLSLRGFARLCGLSPSLLSQVLKGTKHLSYESALKVASKLPFDEAEKEFFLALVEYNRAKNEDVKAALLKNLRRLAPLNEGYILKIESFKFIAEWYHYGIVELSKVIDISLSPKVVSEKFDIPLLEAERALERLINLGLLKEEDGRLVKSKKTVVRLEPDIPNQYYRLHQKGMINRALNALETQTIDQREISSSTFAIGTQKLHEAKKLIRQFHEELAQLVSNCNEKDSVYQFNLQFFRLDNEDRGKLL